MDATLPFGLRSAPLIFSTLADALEWVVRQAGVHYIFHYVDDFIIVGPPASPQCEFGLLTLRQVSQNLGLMLAKDKTEGLSTRLTILDIEVDSMAMTLLLPEEKLVKLRALLSEWQGRKSGLRRDLEFFHVRLNAQCQADIEWWLVFCHCWNGISHFAPVPDTASGCPPLLPCVGILRVGSLLEKHAVSSGVARSSHSVRDHRSKGVVSHFGGVRGVGPPLERAYRSCSLRQRGRGGGNQQREGEGAVDVPPASHSLLHWCVLRLRSHRAAHTGSGQWSGGRAVL